MHIVERPLGRGQRGALSWDLNTLLALVALALCAAIIGLFVRDHGERESIERHLRFDSIDDQREFFEEARWYAAVRSFVMREYVERVDPKRLILNAIDGALRSLDPHSRIIRRKEFDRVRDETRGRYNDIGLRVDEMAPALTVLYPLAGSPADRAGLGPGDRIIEIDGERFADDERDYARERLRGPLKEKVTLRIIPNGASEEQTRLIEVMRTEILEPSVRHAHLLDEQGTILYLAITSFTFRTCQELREAVERFAPTKLILDLRHNPGGVFTQAVEMAGMFIPRGRLVSTRSRGVERETWDADPAKAILADLEVTVLIDEFSASAAEIVAGALQDHGAAAVLGERSYGKGVIQSQKPFPELDIQVKLTTAYYFTPMGRNLQSYGEGRWDGGIFPDYLVRSSRAQREHLSAVLREYDIPARHRAALERYEQAVGRRIVDESFLDRDELVLAARRILEHHPIGALSLPPEAMRTTR